MRAQVCYDQLFKQYYVKNLLDYLPASVKLARKLGRRTFEHAYGHPLLMYLSVYDSDPYGRPLEDAKIVTIPSKSFCQAFVGIVSEIFNGTSETYNDTGGTPRTYSSQSVNSLRVDVVAGVTTYGIQIGTGTQTAAITNTKLNTQYTNTTNFTHGAEGGTASIISAPNGSFQTTRTFTNNTGSGINFTEVGLVCTWGSGSNKMCIAYDLLSFTINNTSSKTVTYTYQATGSS